MSDSKSALSCCAPEDTADGETILVAENDEILRKLYDIILITQGYRVVLAADGNEAIELFDKYRSAIRLIILDIDMPKKNGIDVYNELKKKGPDVKFIVISAYDADIIVDKMMDKKELNYITKPATPRDLILRIKSLLGGK